VSPSRPGSSGKLSKSGLPAPLRYLAYALPRGSRDTDSRVLKHEGFELHDEPIRSSISFLDFDGIVILAGAFEQARDGIPLEMVCIARADLDLRQREFFTAFRGGKTIIFLVSHLPQTVGYSEVESDCDLFRGVAASFAVPWECRKTPFPAVESAVPEFREFVSRYGAGYVVLDIQEEQRDWAKPVCVANKQVYGIVVGDRMFFLPCAVPQTHDQIVKIAGAAVTAVIAYRRRMSMEMPEWTAEFAFSRESALRAQASDLHTQIAQLEGQIDSYISFKGALAYQSNPLVEVVARLLSHFFGISLTIDEKCVEDATLQNSEGAIEAVFEIKGVKGHFTRANVNQVDSHRERLALPSSIPGVLIMNTLMGAPSLQEKDQPPHPDIIQKAVADGVLLIRTLDLLRYADGVERGVLAKDDFKDAILTESGWLKVENEEAQVVKG
jgi:hypothetical protein